MSAFDELEPLTPRAVRKSLSIIREQNYVLASSAEQFAAEFRLQNIYLQNALEGLEAALNTAHEKSTTEAFIGPVVKSPTPAVGAGENTATGDTPDFVSLAIPLPHDKFAHVQWAVETILSNALNMRQYNDLYPCEDKFGQALSILLMAGVNHVGEHGV